MTVRGRSVAYRRAGTGPQIVLLHGFASDSRAWRPQLEGLADSFDLIAWDAPGAGGSADVPPAFTLIDWADDLDAFLGELHADPATVLGISWGGLLAQQLYRQHPSRVRSLVLADTYAGWRGSLGREAADQRLAAVLENAELGPEEFVRRSLPSMFGSVANTEARAELGLIMAHFGLAGFRRMATVLAEADTRGWLVAIAVPTLLLWGDEDARSPLAVGHAFRAAIRGARLVAIPGAGHVTNLEAPDAFNRHVREFLRTLDGPPVVDARVHSPGDQPD